MTADRLHDALQFISTLDDQLRLQPTLEKIRALLDELVQNPANPSLQSSLASVLDTFEEAVGKMRSSITPSEASTIRDLGGAEFFDADIAGKMRRAISTNAMTPSVVAASTQALAQRRLAFMQTVKSTLQGMRKLGFSEERARKPSASLSFLIPRELFQNDLEAFAKELHFIDRFTQDISEGATGNRTTAQLGSLSSSIPTISLEAGAAVIAAIVFVVNKFLDAWERIERIRKLRAELSELGMKGKAIEELTEQVQTTVDTIVSESTEFVIKPHAHSDRGRTHELRNSVANNIKRLYGQIERGLTIEAQAAQSDDASLEELESLKLIMDTAAQMRFPGPSKEPLLLLPAEIMEGELHSSVAKRTVTSKTTTTTRRQNPPKNVQD